MNVLFANQNALNNILDSKGYVHAVSIRGPFAGCVYSKIPAILGSASRPLISGSSQIASRL